MRALLIGIALLLLPLASAQSHEHGQTGPVVITTDLGPSMQAHAGSPVHFALLALGDDLDPDYHVDLPVRVSLNNVTLWETTMVSGHDYDGINTLDVVFPVAGDWEVAAMADGAIQQALRGTVIDTPLRQTRLVLTAPTAATVGEPVTFAYELTDGGRVNHTDALFEVYRDGRLWFRTHTHTHTEAQSLDYAFTEAGTYDIRVTGYTAFPGSAASVLPVVAEAAVVVAGIATGTPVPPSVPATDKNVVIHGSADAPYQLIGTFDPYTVVGQATIQHLNAVVIDPETRMPVQHVDFEATLTGPQGVLFTSDTLHEYDGIYELALRSASLGQHTLTLTAERGDWHGSLSMAYTVAPPVMATVAGPQQVKFSQEAISAGLTGSASFAIAGLGDRPFAHGEIEFEMRGPDGMTLVRNKLHTHDDGVFPFSVTTATAGAHPFTLSPFPLDPQPVTGFGQLDLGLAVAAGPGLAAPGAPIAPTGDDAQAPGAPVALLLVGLALLTRRAL